MHEIFTYLWNKKPDKKAIFSSFLSCDPLYDPLKIYQGQFWTDKIVIEFD